MSKTNVKRNDKGPGSDFINTQRAVDEAINEKIKSENPEGADQQQMNDKSNAEYSTDVDVKKTGRSKR